MMNKPLTFDPTQAPRFCSMTYLLSVTSFSAYTKQGDLEKHRGSNWDKTGAFSEPVHLGFSLKARDCRDSLIGGQHTVSPSCGPGPQWLEATSGQYWTEQLVHLAVTGQGILGVILGCTACSHLPVRGRVNLHLQANSGVQ